MNDSPFEQWYNGMVGFHINSERILEDINWNIDYGQANPEKVRRWMVVCWNNAIDAASNEVSYNCGWNDGEVEDRIQYALGKLKEKT